MSTYSDFDEIRLTTETVLCHGPNETTELGSFAPDEIADAGAAYEVAAKEVPVKFAQTALDPYYRDNVMEVSCVLTGYTSRGIDLEIARRSVDMCALFQLLREAD